MKKPPKTPKGELYPCEVCGESLPFESYPVIENRRADYCRGCAPLSLAGTVEEMADRMLLAKVVRIVAAKREKTPCTYCGKVGHIQDWYKKDGEPVDLHGHVHVRRFDQILIGKILANTTPLCVRCSEIRHSHPKALHKRMEDLFCQVRRAAQQKNEHYRRRLYLQYKALQAQVKKADEEWRNKLED